MQPYEIRQFRDGSIDYNNYYGRPISLTPAVRQLCRWAVSLKPAIAALVGVVAITRGYRQAMQRSCFPPCTPEERSP
jgi:hypothetical protein